MKWIAEILAIAICTSSITPLHGEEAQLPSAGKQIVIEAETAYQKGEYDTFLEQLHEQYQNAGKAGALRGVFESAKATIKPRSSPENYKAQVKELEKKRNERLLEAIEENPDAAIAKKVDSVIFFTLPEEFNNVLSELDSLKYKLPEDTKGSIENKVSALETEYYIKSLLLDIASHRSNSDPDQLAKKKIALSLEKLDKMESAAKEADDIIWIKKIQIAKAAYRADKAYRIDLSVLQSLAVGRINPENAVEKSVKQIMMDYLEQKRVSLDQRTAEIAKK